MTNIYPWTYMPDFLWAQEADTYFTHFQHSLQRQQYEITIFGKTMMQPRLISFYGDEWIKYSYSKTHLIWTWWENKLWVLKEHIEKETWYTFNSVLYNLYRNGNDSMWWHADDEKELWPDPAIASISFWVERFFHLKHIHSWEKHKILLDHGSLLVMKEWSQIHRKHAIMKTKKLIGPRINLTFRKIIS